MLEFDIDRVAELLKARNGGAECALHWFDRIGSTNDFVMGLEAFHGVVCIAGEQTAGRGRRGRVWESAPGAGLYLSMGWDLGGISPAGLSLLCGLSLSRVLRESGVRGVALKWPNDVLLHGSKLAGILVELNGPRCVIGIGLNVTLPRLPERAERASGENAWPRTSLSEHGYTFDAESFTANLIHCLLRDLSTFRRAGFDAFIDSWNAEHAYQGKFVRITGTDTVSGTVVGVDSQGGLCLRLEDGIRVFHVGDVSMKPSDHDC